MDVKTVCLGLLTFGEASGYDIKKHLEAGFEHFFSTGFGSIYPALAALAEEGFATVIAANPGGRPERKVYRITAAGEKALRHALSTCEPAHKLRSELLALLYFAHLVPPERIGAVLDAQLAQMRDALARMKRTGCPGEHEWPGSVRFVQGFGIALHEAAVRYMAANRQLLVPPAPRVPAPRRPRPAAGATAESVRKPSKPARERAVKHRRRAA
ncbi:MAG: PadR family transcriptional regulator [Steroidobacteraceae bacterium]|jgi:DNA-binding PadR family transcriptional regulator|nr:PadR family transcriptional regulator [Steroidobacteraceae bacterium]